MKKVQSHSIIDTEVMIKRSSKKTNTQGIQSKNISSAWATFSAKLSAALDGLQEDQILILQKKGFDQDAVQFVGQGSWGVRAEVISNNFRPDENQLSEAQSVTLTQLGWNTPTGSDDTSAPEIDPDGSPNFYLDLPVPLDCGDLADIAIRTYIQVFRVTHPGLLQYEAFDAFGNPLALPALGLKVALDDEPLGEDALKALLLESISAVTGIHDWQSDGNGIIGGIAYGSGSSNVRLMDFPDAPHARIFAVLLEGAEETFELLKAVNCINSEDGRLHLFFSGGDVIAVTDVTATPFSAPGFANVLGYFCQSVDGLSKRLQVEFSSGNSTSESQSSPLRH